MTKAFGYAVSLRVRHPSWTAAEIGEHLQRTPKFSWTAGEPRTAPNGRPLAGYRSESYCCFDIGKGRDGEIAACLRDALGKLRPLEADLRQLRSSGGSLMLFVSWHPNGDTGEAFGPELLLEMGGLGIELGINVVSRPEPRSRRRVRSR